MTGYWWQTIDDGKGYTPADDLARYVLQPVKSGLVGWFEARRLTPFVEGTAFGSLPDLTDLHNDLVPNPFTTITWTLHVGPPAYIVGTTPQVGNAGGLFSAQDFSGRVNRCTACSIARITVAGNTTIPAGWGQFNADNYGGPAVETVAASHPSAQFGLFPRSDKVAVAPPDWSALGMAWDTISQEATLCHDAQIYRAIGHGQVVGVPVGAGAANGNFGWTNFEIGRGNNLQQIAVALFYLRALSALELLQNDAYMRAVIAGTA